jgi:putative oxidoreductase
LRAIISKLGERNYVFFLQVILGGFFVYSALPKIENPAKFLSAVHQYRLLSDSQSTVFAVVTPWVELLSGLALLTGGVLAIYSTCILVMCLCAFTSAQAAILLRGYSVDCGCFALLGSASKVTWITVSRNLFLLAVSVAALGDGRVRWRSVCYAFGVKQRLLLVAVAAVLSGTVAGVLVHNRPVVTYPPYFRPYSLAAVQHSQSQNRPVILLFTSDVCDYCRCFRELSFRDPRFARKLQMADCFVVTSRKIYDVSSTKAIRAYHVSIYPSFIFVNASGAIMSELVGYHEARDISNSVDTVAPGDVALRSEQL